MTHQMTFRSALIALVATGAAMTMAAPAIAAPDAEGPSIRVRVDLSTEAGRNLAARHVRAAAREICHMFDRNDLAHVAAAQRCFAAAVQNADTQIASLQTRSGSALASLQVPVRGALLK